MKNCYKKQVYQHKMPTA